MKHGSVELLAQPISKETWTEGLLAALAISGNKCILTVGDSHNKAFHEVIKTLNKSQKKGLPGAQRMPSWVPTFYTGKYFEFEDMLVNFQETGITGCVGPYFQSVDILLDDEPARQVLESFNPQEQALLLRLAKIFASGQQQ